VKFASPSMQPIGPSCKVKKRIMNHRIRFRQVSEDEWHHESDESNESNEWKKEKTREPKYSRLQSFLRIRSIRQIRSTFTLLEFGK